METTISLLLSLVDIYLLIGLIFGLVFISVGVTKLDPTAKDGASIGFRLAILPATAALWPLLAKRWPTGITEPPKEKSPHRCAACHGAGCAAQKEAS